MSCAAVHEQQKLAIWRKSNNMLVSPEFKKLLPVFCFIKLIIDKGKLGCRTISCSLAPKSA
jgi:hypothetical protein